MYPATVAVVGEQIASDFHRRIEILEIRIHDIDQLNPGPFTASLVEHKFIHTNNGLIIFPMVNRALPLYADRLDRIAPGSPDIPDLRQCV